MSRMTSPGAALADAMYGIERLGGAHPCIQFHAPRGTAASIRAAANARLKSLGVTHIRIQIYRVNPYIGQTHTATQWEARIALQERTAA